MRARRVRDPGKWAWSSYGAHTGQAPSPVWLDTSAIHGYLLGRDAVTPADRRKAGLRYAALVTAGKGVKLWDEALVQQIFLGSSEFAERMQALINLDPATVKDIPRQQRSPVAKPIEYYLQRNKNRDAGVCDAINAGQHSMTAVANALGLSVSRVSRIVRKMMSEATGKA